MRRHLRSLIFVSLILCLSACHPPATPGVPDHVLVGGWVADDGTIFLFRSDGSFHGVDWKKREIWGNWVGLSDQRIGFQSLMHSSFYNPQYAVINPKNKGSMDYIVSDGTRFISGRRIPPEDAQSRIEAIVEPQVLNPQAPPDPAARGAR